MAKTMETKAVIDPKHEIPVIKVHYALVGLLIVLVFAGVGQWQIHKEAIVNRRQDQVDNDRRIYIAELGSYQAQFSVFESCKSRIAGREDVRAERFGFLDEFEGFIAGQTPGGVVSDTTKLFFETMKNSVNTYLPSIDVNQECGIEPPPPLIPPTLQTDTGTLDSTTTSMVLATLAGGTSSGS